MSASVTVRGFVATQPKLVIVGENLPIASFRLGASTRRFSPTTNQWETTNTSWFSVSCFRDLATNAFASLNKGDPVLITGVLKVSEWSAGDKSGLDVEITADSIGHDQRWGKATGFARTASKRGGRHDGDRDEGFAQPGEPAPVLSAPAAPPAAGDGWANPAATFAAASVADAGEPTVPLLELAESDEELLEGDEELLESVEVAPTPF